MHHIPHSLHWFSLRSLHTCMSVCWSILMPYSVKYVRNVWFILCERAFAVQRVSTIFANIFFFCFHQFPAEFSPHCRHISANAFDCFKTLIHENRTPETNLARATLTVEKRHEQKEKKAQRSQSLAKKNLITSNVEQVLILCAMVSHKLVPLVI